MQFLKSFLIILLGAVFLFPYRTSADHFSKDTTNQNHIRDKVENLPVIFRKNAGQWDEKVLYRGYSAGSNVYFLKNSLSFAHNRFSEKGKAEYIVWNLHFEGSNENVEIFSGGRSVSRTNYILGNDSKKHVANVPDYREILYSNIYNSIDLRYYGNEKNLKYDYILKPGSDVNDIRMKCEGIDNIEINSSGELLINHKWGTVKENKPYSYQSIEGKEVEVDIRFVKYDSNTFGFKIFGEYNSEYEIVLDPVTLLWGTYVGGTDPSKGGYLYDLTTDKGGNIYATGYYPASFPVTSGSYDNTYNGGVGDAYVFKLDPDGEKLIYATYIGGNDDDRGNGIAVNDEGEVYITGHTLSSHTSFPTTTRLGSMTGSTNSFVCKLNASGSSLMYFTYIGGLNQDIARDIKVDSIGNAYVCGETKSANFPVTAGSLRTTYGGGASDGFLFKLNSSGTAFLYSTYLGGSNDDRCKSLVIGNGGRVHVTGYTNSSNFPVTWGSLRGSFDVFVTKVNTTGGGIIYSAIVGGSDAEEGNSIDVNEAGEAFVTGYTISGNFPVTVPFSYKGFKDVFVFRLNASGNGLIYSRYLGGVKHDEATSIVVNVNNLAFIAGTTESDDFPIVESGIEDLEPSRDREDQVFVSVISANGQDIRKSIRAGGSFDDYKIPSLAFPNKNFVCDVSLGFTSHSPDLHTTPGAFQQVKLNGNEANDQPAVLKFDFSPDWFDTTTVKLDSDTIIVCPGQVLHLKGPNLVDIDYPLIYSWKWADEYRKYHYRGKDFVALVDTIAYVNKLGILKECHISIKFSDGCNTYEKEIWIFMPLPPKVWIGVSENLCVGSGVTLHANAFAYDPQYKWSTGSVSSAINIDVSGWYSVEIKEHCERTAKDSIYVEVKDKPRSVLGVSSSSNRILCFPGTHIIDATHPDNVENVTYRWSTGENTPTISITSGGNYWVEMTNSCGTSKFSVTIEERRAPEVSLGRDTSICDNGEVVLHSGFPDLPTRWSTGQNTPSITITEIGTYWVEVTNVCGTSRDSIEVGRSEEAPSVDLGPDLTLCEDPDLFLDAGYPSSNYLWSTGEETPVIHVIKGGQYYVTVTNGCGTASDTIEIISNPQLSLDLPAYMKTCTPATIVLDAGNPGGDAVYQWSNGANTQTIELSASGTYSVSVSNICGSVSGSSELVFEASPPVIDLGPDMTVCDNVSTTLSAGVVADSYLWSTGETTISIEVDQVGEYWVETGNSCGTSRESIMISFYPSLALELGPDKSICAPAAVQYNAGNPGAQYLWSTNETSQTITVNQTGKYWVRVSNQCEVISDTAYLTINDQFPNVDLGADRTICEAFQLTLDAGNNPGTTYSWLPGGQTSQSIVVSSGGRYIVEATNGCGVVKDTLLIISELLNPFLEDVRLCYLASIDLDAGNPGSTYLWSTMETTQVITVEESGEYHVDITNACGSVRENIAVSMDTETPSIDLGPDIRECSPISITLDAGNPGARYLWSTGQTSASIHVTEGGTYTVTCINGCGTSVGSVKVIVDQTAPNLALGPDIFKCSPFRQKLDAGFSGVDYLWYPSLEKTESISVSAGGIFSCVATNACGTDSASVEVKSYDFPQIDLQEQLAVCQGPVDLDAGNEGSDFLWYPGGENTQVISVNQSGNYEINISNVCGIVAKKIKVVVDDDIPQINLGADVSLCSPLGMVLDAGAYPMATYLWSNGLTDATITVKEPGDYSVTVTNACGPNSASRKVLSNPIVINAAPDTAICFGNSVQLLSHYDETFRYEWTPYQLLDNYQIHNPLGSPETSTYFKVRVDNGTCWNWDSVYVQVYPEMKTDIKASAYEGYVPLRVEFSDQLNADSQNSYIWYFGDGDSSLSRKPVHTFKEEDHYQVMVKVISPNGCYIYDTLKLKSFSLFIPNLVTINGDGKNDFFALTKLHDYINVEIYNRWGDLIFRKENYVDEWPDRNISDGVYFYLVKDEKYRKEFKGWVHVVNPFYGGVTE